MTATLIDTSAWVDFFRGDSAARRRIDPLLEDGSAATCGPVFAEVVSGARDRRTFERLSQLLRALTWLDDGANAWSRIAEIRFVLARQGIQAHLVDLQIALAAAESQARLLTRDRDFEPISGLLAVDATIF